MPGEIKVKDIMAREAIVVSPEDKLGRVMELLSGYGYDGVPVVDKDKRLVGIITEYDMVSKSTGLHLPTILKVLGNMSSEKKDRKFLEESLEAVSSIKAKDIMNPDPLTVNEEASVEDAVKEFAAHHRVNPILVVDGGGKLSGIVSRFDIIRFFNGEYLHDVSRGVPMRGESFEGLRRRRAEVQVNALMERIGKDYFFVNKMRPMLWKFFAIAMFIVGFITSLAWIVRVAFR